MTFLQTVYDMTRLTGLSFLFVILPLFLVVFYLAPGRARPAVLLGLSLVFYFLSEPYNLLLMGASLVTDYAALRFMEHYDDSPWVRRGCLWVSVVKNVCVIVFSGALAQIQDSPMVFGLQVYTLSALSCVLATYSRQLPYERSIVRFGLYCCFFPKLCAGPLLPYSDFAPQLNSLGLNLREVLGGMGRLIQGVFKAAVFGSNLFILYESVREVAQATALSSWVLVFSIAFSLYFMLSGYSDIAQGVGAMFGIKLPQNFYYPYQSRNVEDFFDRFNISVGKFIRSTVYVGLQGDRNGKFSDILNLLVTGILMGLWFGLRINYLVWGAYFAVFIILEKYVYPRVVAGFPTLLCRATTLCVVLASFTIFSGESLGESARLIRTMLDFRNFYNDEILYLLSANWLLLLLSCLLATNGVSLVVTNFRRAAPRISSAVLGTMNVGVLILYVALTL